MIVIVGPPAPRRWVRAPQELIERGTLVAHKARTALALLCCAGLVTTLTAVALLAASRRVEVMVVLVGGVPTFLMAGVAASSARVAVHAFRLGLADLTYLSISRQRLTTIGGMNVLWATPAFFALVLLGDVPMGVVGVIAYVVLLLLLPAAVLLPIASAYTIGNAADPRYLAGCPPVPSDAVRP